MHFVVMWSHCHSNRGKKKLRNVVGTLNEVVSFCWKKGGNIIDEHKEFCVNKCKRWRVFVSIVNQLHIPGMIVVMVMDDVSCFTLFHGCYSNRWRHLLNSTTLEPISKYLTQNIRFCYSPGSYSTDKIDFKFNI